MIEWRSWWLVLPSRIQWFPIFKFIVEVDSDTPNFLDGVKSLSEIC